MNSKPRILLNDSGKDKLTKLFKIWLEERYEKGEISEKEYLLYKDTK